VLTASDLIIASRLLCLTFRVLFFIFSIFFFLQHFTTTSYVQDGIRDMAGEADRLGVCLLNEMGVDPGLDFMSAQQLIDDVHARGGQVAGFYSICGGLPHPAHNDNPFGYKLSWSPRGVLLASRNPALYLEHGRRVEVAGKDLYTPQIYRTERIATVEGQAPKPYEWYPNRDSIKYVQEFNIPEVQTIIRVRTRDTSSVPCLCACAVLR
jgi:saccharopine dehydrogenase (NADP+, L-glutamate forming)